MIRAGMLLGLFVVSVSALALDPSGDPDTSFDGDGYQGINITLRNTDAAGRGIVIQPDGKVVITGEYWDNGQTHVAVTRYNTDGTFDAGFGVGGEVKTIVSANDLAFAVALQDDGKLVVVGSANSGADESYLVLRYNSNGTLDNTFSGDGIFILNAALNGNTFDRARGVAIQPDQKIVVGGYSTIGAGDERDGVLFRLTTAGVLDTSFSGDGISYVSTSSGSTVDEILAVTVSSTGLIYASGRTSTGGHVSRLTSAGVLDATFDGDGIAIDNPISGTRYLAVKLDDAGRPVMAGSGGGSSQLVITRRTTGGALDNTFDGDGWMSTTILAGQSRANCLAIESSTGDIYASGHTDTDNAGVFQYFAMRLNSNGGLDTGFSGDGKVNVDPSASGLINAPLSCGLQGDGKFIVGGSSAPAANPTAPKIALTRFTTGGVLDTSFDGDGIVFRQLQGGSVDSGYGLALNGSGQVYVTGYSDVTTHSDVAVARLSTTGALDSGWDSDGVALVGGASTFDEARGAVVQADGKLIAGGHRSNVSAPASPRLAAYRFTTGGVLDTGYSGDGIAEGAILGNGVTASGTILDGSGRAIVFGSGSDNSSNSDFIASRFQTNGNPDTTFDGDGHWRLSLGASFDGIHAAAVQDDGKIVFVGFTVVSGGEQWAMVRLNADGTADSTFNGDGNTDGVILALEGSGNIPRGRALHVSILPDGKINVLGRSNVDGTNNRVRSGRFLSNGAVDSSYGVNGFQSISLGSNRIDNINGGAIQFDEKLIAFGAVTPTGSGTDFLVVRVNWDDGSLDTTYATSGVRQFAATAARDIGEGGRVDSSGRAYLVGQGNSGDLGAARLRADPVPTPAGTPDLVSASDSGRSNSDNITNDNTPTFSGSCVVGETVVLYVNGAEHTPRTRHLCRSTTYSLTAPTLADGNYVIAMREINGAGQAALSGNLGITVDTVAAAPSISAPTANQKITIPPAPNMAGAGAEADADVLVHNGPTQLCNVRAAASPANNAAWSCATGLGLGAFSLTARQVDIAGNTSANAPVSFSQVVQTTVSVSSGPNPSRFGQSVSFGATVQTVPNGFATPSGCVVITVAGQASSCIALASGAASIARSDLPVGNHAVSVSFAEQNYFLASNGNLAAGQDVIKADTSLSITPSSNPVVYGQPLTLDIAASALAPGAGVVDGGVDLLIGGTPSVQALVGGAVAVDASNLSVGNHAVAGNYTGSASFNSSSGSVAGGVQVNKAAVELDLIQPTSTPVSGQNFGLGVIYRAASPSLATPSGQVELHVDGQLVDTFVASASQQTSNLSLSAGNHSISLTYAGDAGFNGASIGENLAISKASATLGVQVDLDPSYNIESKTFTLIGEVATPGSGTPSGQMHLTIGNLPAIDLTPVNGTAVYETAAIPPGNWAVSATQDADANVESSATSLMGGITVIDVMIFGDGFE